MQKFLDYVQKPSYLKDNNNEGKKKQGRKKCVVKKLEFQDYKKCLKASQIINTVN